MDLSSLQHKVASQGCEQWTVEKGNPKSKVALMHELHAVNTELEMKFFFIFMDEWMGEFNVTFAQESA